MPTIVYVQPDGTRRAIDVAVGTSVMQGAVQNGVPGIDAECGGSAMCATCHVYLDPADLGRLPGMDPVENEMLDSTASERSKASRLSCQIVVTDALDGLRVHLPPSQT